MICENLRVKPQPTIKRMDGIFNRILLLQKLEHYGIHGNTLDLLGSYLTERKH